MTDSTTPSTEKTKETEAEKEEEEATAVTAATSTTSTLIPEDTVKVDLSEYVFKPNFKPLYKRVESTQEDEDYNSQIKKPFIMQID